MSKSRLQSLLMGRLGLESDRPAETVDEPAVVLDETVPNEIPPVATETPSEETQQLDEAAAADEAQRVAEAAVDATTPPPAVAEVAAALGAPESTGTVEDVPAVPASDEQRPPEEVVASEEGFKDIIAFITSKEKRLEWSLKKMPDDIKEAEAEVLKLKNQKAEAEKAGKTSAVKELSMAIANWEYEVNDLKETEEAFKEDLAKLQAKRAKVSKESLGVEGEGDENTERAPAEEDARSEAEAAAERPAANEDADVPPPVEELPPVEEETPPAEVAATDEEPAVADAPAESTEAPAAELPPIEEAPAAEAPVEGDAEVPSETAEAEVVAEPTAAPEATETPAEIPAATEETAAAVDAVAVLPIDNVQIEPAVVAETVPADAVAATPAVTEGEVIADVVSLDDNAAGVSEDGTDPEHVFVGVVQGESTLNDITGSMEDLFQIVDSLESISSDIRDSLQSGGLQPQAAKMMDHALSAYTYQLGVSQRIMPSLENFGGASSRIESSKASLEGIKEVVDSIWENIKRLAKAAWMSISDYLINVSKASQFIRTKGYDLEETVKSLQSSGKVIPLANRTMTIPASLSRRLAVGDKVSSDLDKSVKSLLDLAQAASEYDKECKTALEEERKALGDYLTGGKFETAVKVFQGGSFDSVMTTGAKFFKGEQTYPGNVMFTLRKLAVSIGSISVPTHDFQKINLSDKHAEEEKKISTPSLETLHELAKVCQEVDKIAQHMKDEARVLNTQVDKMFANVFGAEGDNESLPAEFRALMSLYKRRAVALNKTSSLIVGHLVTTARAALAVAAMAVKEYETIG